MGDKIRGPRNPNQTTVYTRDSNLLNLRKLKSMSGFWNWCIGREDLREEFNNLKVK